MESSFDNCRDSIQERLEESMPWVGRYILAASILCTLAVAADAFNGFRRKKLWFPSKYFFLDATTLTLLGIAMKLPMDLTTIMTYSGTDLAAKFSSITFMSTAIGNFMSSLGSMNDKEILANVVALGILVFTVAIDMLIQHILLMDIVLPFYYVIPTVLMLFCFATLVSMAITVPTTKRSLELKYEERHKVALKEEEVIERREAFMIDDQRGYMMKYWVMAETSNPQFVLARSVIPTTSAIFCLVAALILAYFFTGGEVSGQGATPYKNSTMWILCVQSVGVAVGTIVPVLRWFVVVSFKCSTPTTKKGFKIEPYWMQTLVDWRESFSALRINRQDKYRKCLHDAKWYVLTLCIWLQILIVLLSKLLVSLSSLLFNPFFLCFNHIKKLVKQKRRDEKDLNYLRPFVLLLEDEAELPTRVLRNIYREADNTIQAGRKKQPKNLLDLLKKFDSFNGVGDFDSNRVPSLLSEEPPNSWTLPVVTLTSIAIALPNIEKQRSQRLLRNVSEGFSLAKLVEKTLVKNAQLINIRKAADTCWVGVVLYMKWLDIDLNKMSLKCKNSKEVLQKLSEKAEWIFKKQVQGGGPKPKISNSMFRISRTLLLLSDEGGTDQSTEGLFKRISIMIADIMAACFTNLPHAITTMCHHNAIEKREKSVRKAFLLLGKTEEIIKLVQKHEWPSLDHDKAASIEEWRALFRQNKGGSTTLASASVGDERVMDTVLSTEEQLAIEVDS